MVRKDDAYEVVSVIFDRGMPLKKGKSLVDDHDLGGGTSPQVIEDIQVQGSQVLLFLANGTKVEYPRALCQIKYVPVPEPANVT